MKQNKNMSLKYLPLGQQLLSSYSSKFLLTLTVHFKFKLALLITEKEGYYKSDLLNKIKFLKAKILAKPEAF